MKKRLGFLIVFLLGLNLNTSAQVTEIISIIKMAVTKVIKAVDLEVQRLQTQTIWLQDAQKELENTMSALKLEEIRDWVQKQKDLYENYYQELATVKQIISDYDRVKEIISIQSKIVSEYKMAYSNFKKDRHFSAAEVDYMMNVYSGIVEQSLANIDQVMIVVNQFSTTMNDEARLSVITEAAKAMETNYKDLRLFNNEAIQLSLLRAKASGDAATVKQLYGLP